MIITIDLNRLTAEQRAYLEREAATATQRLDATILVEDVAFSLLAWMIDEGMAAARAADERRALVEEELRERGSIGGGQ